MVLNTSELLPEPETPVNTVSRRFGSSTLTSLRLFTRAPCTRIRSWRSATYGAGGCVSVLVAMLIVSPTVRWGRLRGLRRRRPAQWRAQSSTHRFRHERADPCLVGGGQLLQREGDRPQGAFVEVRLVAEGERGVPRFELLDAFEEADDSAVLGIRGHPVPGFRREGWRAGFDDGMEPRGHGAIWFRHLGDLREHVAFRVRIARARTAARGRLQLLGALPHRGSFLVRESLGRLAGGSLGGLLRRVLHCRVLLCEV